MVTYNEKQKKLLSKKQQVETKSSKISTLTLHQFPSKCICCGCLTQGSHPENSLRLAGEILVKLAAGKYTPSETSGAWEVIETLLSSYFKNKGTYRER